MREYSGGTGSVTKHRGKWRGMVRYRDVIEDEDGNEVKGEWKYLAKTFDIKSYPGTDNNRGKKSAQEACRKWRDQLIAEEPERSCLEAEERAQREAAAEGRFVPTPRSTVAEYLDYYLTEKLPNEKRIEDSTMTGYKWRASLIDSRIGDVKLRDLRAGAVEQFRNWLNKNYAPTTVRDVLRLLNTSLKSATKDGLIDSNPAADITSPAPEAEEPNYLTETERTRLMADIDATLHGSVPRRASKAQALAVELALHTGMREGEVCGLRWRDVDLEGEPAIHVRTSIGRVGGSGYYEKSTKSGAGRRTIPIQSPLLDDLAERRGEVEKTVEGFDVDVDELFVVGEIDGSFMQPRSLYRSWHRRVERLGLVGKNGEPPTFHDLRHTFATVMAHSKVPAKSLQTIMGHKNIETTYRYYIGVDEEANRLAMQMTLANMTGRADNIVEFPKTGTEG